MSVTVIDHITSFIQRGAITIGFSLFMFGVWRISSMTSNLNSDDNTTRNDDETIQFRDIFNVSCVVVLVSELVALDPSKALVTVQKSNNGCNSLAAFLENTILTWIIWQENSPHDQLSNVQASTKITMLIWGLISTINTYLTLIIIKFDIITLNLNMTTRINNTLSVMQRKSVVAAGLKKFILDLCCTTQRQIEIENCCVYHYEMSNKNNNNKYDSNDSIDNDSDNNSDRFSGGINYNEVLKNTNYCQDIIIAETIVCFEAGICSTSTALTEAKFICDYNKMVIVAY